MITIFLCLFVLFLSLVFTGILRFYALKQGLLDIPNERSSHLNPTPRGGGLSITISVLLSTGIMYYLGLLSFDVLIAFGTGGLIVAIIAWFDDHKDIPAIWRAIFYTIAAIWSVSWLGGLDKITLGAQEISLGFTGTFLAVLGIVWLTNLYNFMDGTDALASVQAICAGIISGILFLLSGKIDLATLCFVIATSSAGFMYWNWPPAKIFMGDVGSCLIGFSFGVLALLGEKSNTLPVLVWFIFMAAFICDASLTLFMRLLKKEKWYKAHRVHAYQRIVQMGCSHAQLATGLLLLNILFLWPMAYIAYRWEKISVIAMMSVLILMCILWGYIQYKYHKIDCL